jgi:uncharacterized membrane-anchored protein
MKLFKFSGREIINKVPEVTIFFWIIKILCTTVGETAADFLSTSLNWGLTATTLVMTAILIVTLFFQFRSNKYIPGLYWFAVVLISIVGTQITDNLSDNLGISLITTTTIFAVILAIIFAIWYSIEKTLSIHSINTLGREAFYWLAVLFTFALGTAAGDLMAERLALGYLTSLFIFAAGIGIVTLAHYTLRAYLGRNHKHMTTNAVLAFWIAYILTRPLGASIGDYLSQAQGDGGLALGTTVTSGIFLGAILITVIYLAVTKKDVTTSREAHAKYL